MSDDISNKIVLNRLSVEGFLSLVTAIIIGCGAYYSLVNADEVMAGDIEEIRASNSQIINQNSATLASVIAIEKDLATVNANQAHFKAQLENQREDIKLILTMLRDRYSDK